MSILSVYHVSTPELPNKVLTHPEDIASTLAEHGVGFEQWQAVTSVAPGSSAEQVISVYQGQIDQWMTERGYSAVDVISVDRDHAQKAELRARFLDEHEHVEDEVRFFAAGRGLLMLHIGDYVYAVLCEKNDLISVPAGTRQWFDMGEHPHVVAIRLFNSPEGSAARFTGDDIANHFPRHDD